MQPLSLTREPTVCALDHDEAVIGERMGILGFVFVWFMLEAFSLLQMIWTPWRMATRTKRGRLSMSYVCSVCLHHSEIMTATLMWMQMHPGSDCEYDRGDDIIEVYSDVLSGRFMSEPLGASLLQESWICFRRLHTTPPEANPPQRIHNDICNYNGVRDARGFN